MREKSKKIYKERKSLVLVAMFLFGFYALLIIQFYKLQILEGNEWSREAELQHQQCVYDPFQRGRFFSNTSIQGEGNEVKQPFVYDVAQFHLYVDPSVIDQKSKLKILQYFSKRYGFLTEKREKMAQDLFRKCRSRKILSWLSQEEKTEIEKWWQDFYKKEELQSNALFFVKDFKRSYPFGSLLGQVLSTLQEKDPYEQQAIPVGGLELYFDPFLQGKKGKRVLLRSPRQILEGGKIIQGPQDGADIFLTINHYLQAIAEEEVKKGVEAVSAKGGWAVVMNPHTGEIYALAQYPFFNPLEYNQYFNDPKKEKDARCLAVCDAFEPGSIFKPVTLALCFLANEELKKRNEPPLFDPEEKVSTKDGKFPGRKKPIQDGHHHSFLNMDLALQKSSNVYVARMAERIVKRLGEEWYQKTLVDVLGFGKKTGIELPAETSGQVPTYGKFHPSGRPEWSIDTPFSLAFGHNILVNTLQMAAFYSMLANGGYEIKPTLIQKIVQKNQGGQEENLFDLKEKYQHVERRKVLPAVYAKRLVQGLKYVTKSGGTSIRGDIFGYSDGGKSGTSEKIINGQYSHESYISSFIGIVPANHPGLVIVVIVDEPKLGFIPYVGKAHHGGVCAAPIFQKIATRTLEYLGVAPDDPYGYPYGDVRANRAKADWSQEVKKLQEIYHAWNH